MERGDARDWRNAGKLPRQTVAAVPILVATGYGGETDCRPDYRNGEKRSGRSYMVRSESR